MVSVWKHEDDVAVYSEGCDPRKFFLVYGATRIYEDTK